MLTVQEIAELPELGLAVVAGAEGLRNEVSWLHVSELADPTQFLEGGEFLLTTGLGVGEMATTQRAYVRRLAKHGLAGLGFGVGFGFPDVELLSCRRASIGQRAAARQLTLGVCHCGASSPLIGASVL